MKKKLLLASAFVALINASAQTAQHPFSTQKWDCKIQTLFQQQHNVTSVKSMAVPTPVRLIVSCNNASAVMQFLEDSGCPASQIDERVVTAQVPTQMISRLADMKEVDFISSSKKVRASMNTARKAIEADKVHAGQELETPFTGKGVVVGVIDQGFQFRHVAFSDKNGISRVKALWNHAAGMSPTTTINEGGDFIGAYGHATHVTNIAAGSKTKYNDFYGIAPEADIVMIPSSFETADIIQEAKYIKDFAKNQGKPYVINMSFGSQIGPHDGTDSYSQTMNTLAGTGGILVAAMGNEGTMKIHTTHKFTGKKEVVRVLFTPDQSDPSFHVIDIWEQTADGRRHVEVRPFTALPNNLTPNYQTSWFWSQSLSKSHMTDPYNYKENHYFEVDINKIKKSNSSNLFGLEIEGNPGDEIHLWVNPGYGEIRNVTNKMFLQGDDQYCVGEGAATIPQAISVASFNSNDGHFISAIDNTQYSFTGLTNQKGQLSFFSSRGPFLGNDKKPTVAAPGGLITSAFSKYDPLFKKTDVEITSIANIDPDNKLKVDYYGVMSGTSMATPAVTGTIALWLQANPELTPDDIKEIIQKTSNHDQYATEGWNNNFGYGKINAYAGLKKALQMIEQSGINDQLNSETPISIQRTASQFRILFNNDESFASISLLNTSGKEIKRIQLNDIHRGQEEILSTNTLSAGVYIVRVNTTASTTSKKMLVK